MNTELRKDCPMRHENGNCQPAGGFCTAVNDPICEALHNAYDRGWRAAALWARQEAEKNEPPSHDDMLQKLIEIFDSWNLKEYIPFHTERAMLAYYLLHNGVIVPK